MKSSNSIMLKKYYFVNLSCINFEEDYAIFLCSFRHSTGNGINFTDPIIET